MRIAMLLHKTVEHDSRVRREARALAAAGHRVTVLHLPRVHGECDGDLDGFSVRSVTPPGWVRRRLPSILYRSVFLASFLLAILRLRPDVVHAHDAAMLAPGMLGAWATGAELVYDSHEYAAGVPYRDPRWARGVAALERIALPRCGAVITVSDGIAARIQADHGLARRPTVIRNLPDPADTDLSYEAPDLRRELGLSPSTPLVLHLGAVALERGCESLVRAMAAVPDAHLLFLGADDDAYAAGLARLADREGLSERVHLLPSVPVSRIRAHVRQADVGVSLLENTCENHRLALPNKVFEYMAAGIPVVVSDLPELKKFVDSRGVGRGADPASPDDVAAAISAEIRSARSSSTPGGNVPTWGEEQIRLRDLFV